MSARHNRQCQVHRAGCRGYRCRCRQASRGTAAGGLVGLRLQHAARKHERDGTSKQRRPVARAPLLRGAGRSVFRGGGRRSAAGVTEPAFAALRNAFAAADDEGILREIEKDDVESQLSERISPR